MDTPKACLAGVLAANVAVLISPASGQTNPQDEPSQPPVIVYVQVADARFDSYLYLKKIISPGNSTNSSDEFFYIPRSNSKEREKEFADWRRKFRLIVSAATLSERVQPKISQVKEAFDSASRAAECWTVDKNRERRITITVIGSAGESAVRYEYEAASRDFFVDPKSFTCKYRYDVGQSIPGP